MTTAPPVVRERTIRGASAVLLPFDATGGIDWDGFVAHLERTLAAGLEPAVNMDTGFGPFLDPATRRRVLEVTRGLTDRFIAGAHVDDEPGAAFDATATLTAAVEVASAGGTPIIFPSHGAAGLGDDEVVDAHRLLADEVDELLGFELGPMFHPAGRIYPLDVFEALIGIEQVRGLKHSSLRRDLEWDRLRCCAEHRPDFALMTGNDLAIDMVVYGSDYLLGLSTFAPDAFGERDRAWAAGDDGRFWELNDLLQYLGQFAFRAPVPAYRHDAAMFLHARGWLDADRTHDRSASRPASDAAVLTDIAERLEALLS